jgi:AcrR family transcriptional regulator
MEEGRMISRTKRQLKAATNAAAQLPSWVTESSVLDLRDEEATRRLTGSLRDERVRRAVVAVLAKALDERGYEGVTFPYVARLAGVAIEDVRRVFPSKGELVLAALGPGAWSQAPFGLPGAEIVARYLAFWERGDNTTILRELLCAAVSNPRLAATLERHVLDTVIRPFAEEDQSTDAYPRARLAFAALLGLAVSRYVLRQEPLASADHETLTAWMGPSLDRFLHGTLDDALTRTRSVTRSTLDQPVAWRRPLAGAQPATRKRPAGCTRPAAGTESREPDLLPWSGRAWTTEPMTCVPPL